MKKLWLMLLFPLAVCTDTNGIIAPYKAVTNTFSITNAVTNIHTVTQVNYHFTTTNRFEGYALLSRVPGGEWHFDGGSPTTQINWIIGTQSPRDYMIWLMNKPAPVEMRLVR